MIREGKKLPSTVQQKVREIVQIVEADSDIMALYAFGSLAAGALKPLSDLDFGVLLNDRLDKRLRFDKQIELIGIFNDTFATDEIDLFIMNDAPIKMVFQILKTGKMLVCRNTGALIDFRECIVKKYLDFRYMREAFDTVFLEGIGYHG